MGEEQCLRALRRVAEVIKTMKETRKLDREMRGSLNMEAKVPVMDRVYDAFKSFEDYVRSNQLQETVRPGAFEDSQ